MLSTELLRSYIYFLLTPIKLRHPFHCFLKTITTSVFTKSKVMYVHVYILYDRVNSANMRYELAMQLTLKVQATENRLCIRNEMLIDVMRQHTEFGRLSKKLMRLRLVSTHFVGSTLRWWILLHRFNVPVDLVSN